MPKQVFDLEEVKAMFEFRDRFNAVPLRDLVLTAKGKVIDIPVEAFDDWEETGLSNCAFMETLLEDDNEDAGEDEEEEES